MNDLKFEHKFRIQQLLIKETEFWIISLRPKQVTFGSLVLSLKRECPSLSKLTNEESADLSNAFQLIDKMLEVVLKPSKINYLALMMVDEQVHFHVIPRYESSIIYKDIQYNDSYWPKPPSVLESLTIDEDVLHMLITSFQNSLGS